MKTLPSTHSTVVTRLLQQTERLAGDLKNLQPLLEAAPISEHSVTELDDRATEAVCNARNSITMAATVSLATTESRTALAAALVDAAQRGVNVVLLLGPHDLHSPLTGRTLARMRKAGVKVRIAMHAPALMVLVIDHEIAFVRPLSNAEPGLILTGTPVCRAMALLTTAFWSRSYAALPPPFADSVTRLTVQQRNQLLELLVCGEKDEAAARVLGVSLRTFRRYVRQLMDELGASSRFQAGFLAAERGWYTSYSRR